METFSMINIVAVGLITGKTGKFIGDNGIKVELMGLAYFVAQQVNHTVVNIRMIKNMVSESQDGNQVKNYHAIGRMENNMV